MTAPVRPPQPTRQLDDPDETPAGDARVAIRRLEGLLVLQPLGTLDDGVEAQLREAMSGADRPVVIDLDDCVVVDPFTLERVLVADASAAIEVCIVCRRLSCRRLLASAGVSNELAVFERVEDALQARVFARDGYGSGWS